MKTMWWFCRDGEGCLAGHRTGLSAKLKAENPFLVDHHCDAHVDQLAHKDADSTACGPRMQELGSCIEEVGKFLEKAPAVDTECRRRSKQIKETQRGVKIPAPSGTRWIHKAREIRQYRRGSVSRMQVFSKRVRHKKVKKEDRDKMKFLLDKQRRFSNIFLTHVLEDYLNLKWIKNRRLQSRGMSLGQPQKEAHIFKQKALGMFPSVAAHSTSELPASRIVGGASTKALYEDLH